MVFKPKSQCSLIKAGQQLLVRQLRHVRHNCKGKNCHISHGNLCLHRSQVETITEEPLLSFNGCCIDLVALLGALWEFPPFPIIGAQPFDRPCKKCVGHVPTSFRVIAKDQKAHILLYQLLLFLSSFGGITGILTQVVRFRAVQLKSCLYSFSTQMSNLPSFLSFLPCSSFGFFIWEIGSFPCPQ